MGRCLVALARAEPTGRSHAVTGPDTLDFTAIANIAAQAWGRPVTYRPISAAEYLARLAGSEDPWWAYAYTSMFASIREQRWDLATSDVQRITGSEPRQLGKLLTERGDDDVSARTDSR